MFYSLVEAIALHRQALLESQEIFIFPPDFNPCDCQNSLNSAVPSLSQPERTEDSLQFSLKLE
jgi:hypothetical protein